MSSLDDAFAKVLSNPHFALYGRDRLLKIGGFSEAIRTAPHQDLKTLERSLEAIAFENEDHNEASGLLMVTVLLGGGMETAVTHRDDLPITDPGAFAELVIATPPADRAALVDEVMDALIRHVVTLAPGDREGWRTHHYVGALTEYGLRPARDLRYPDSTAHWNRGLTWEERVPPRLWDVFDSRPDQEREQLTAAWWSDAAKQPHDLTIALALESQGLVVIARTAAYLEAVAAHVLHEWAPDSDGEALDEWGAKALAEHGGLAAEFYAALATSKGFSWLTAVGGDARRAYVRRLANAGLIDGPTLTRLIDEGLARGWGGPRDGRALVVALREALP